MRQGLAAYKYFIDKVLIGLDDIEDVRSSFLGRSEVDYKKLFLFFIMATICSCFSTNKPKLDNISGLKPKSLSSLKRGDLNTAINHQLSPPLNGSSTCKGQASTTPKPLLRGSFMIYPTGFLKTESECSISQKSLNSEGGDYSFLDSARRYVSDNKRIHSSGAFRNTSVYTDFLEVRSGNEIICFAFSTNNKNLVQKKNRITLPEKLLLSKSNGKLRSGIYTKPTGFLKTKKTCRDSMRHLNNLGADYNFLEDSRDIMKNDPFYSSGFYKTESGFIEMEVSGEIHCYAISVDKR